MTNFGQTCPISARLWLKMPDADQQIRRISSIEFHGVIVEQVVIPERVWRGNGAEGNDGVIVVAASAALPGMLLSNLKKIHILWSPRLQPNTRATWGPPMAGAKLGHHDFRTRAHGRDSGDRTGLWPGHPRGSRSAEGPEASETRPPTQTREPQRRRNAQRSTPQAPMFGRGLLPLARGGSRRGTRPLSALRRSESRSPVILGQGRSP